MTTQTLTTVEIDPRRPAQASVIWLHGLGADAHDFEPIVPYLELPPELGVRFVFPNAPQRPVTINGGLRMRAWYDVLGLDLPRNEDAAGIRDSARAIEALIRRETERGIAGRRIVLAGFSQGGAMTLYTGLRHAVPLAGLLALSSYLPLADSLAEERHPANQSVPIFMVHGRHDEVIPLHYGRASLERLQALGYTPQWQDYPMGHEVNLDEIRAIGAWLRRILAPEE